MEARDLKECNAAVALCERETGCGKGQRDAMRALLEAGADALARRNDGCCAPSVAAEKGHVGLLHLLLPCYAAAEARHAVYESLWDARVEGYVHMVEVLVREGGGDVWQRDEEGRRPSTWDGSRGSVTCSRRSR